MIPKTMLQILAVRGFEEIEFYQYGSEVQINTNQQLFESLIKWNCRKHHYSDGGED